MLLKKLLDCDFSDSWSEFHKDAPENVRLSRSIRGVGVVFFI